MNEEEKARIQQWFEAEEDYQPDPLAPAKGLINGLLMASVLWVVIFLLLAVIFKW